MVMAIFPDNIVRNKKKLTLEKIFSVVLVCLPIVNQIGLLGYSFVDLFSTIFTIFVILRYNGKLRIDVLTVLYVIITVSTFCFSLLYDSVSNAVLSSTRLLCIYIGFIYGARLFLNVEIAKKWYLRLCLFASILLMVQMLAYYIFNLQMYFIPEGITLNYGGQMNSTELIASRIVSVNGGYFFRPSSFFIEPAYFSYYVVPCIGLLLFDDSITKKSLYSALFLSIATVLTTSTIALVGTVGVWVGFIVFGTHNLSARTKKTVVTVVLVAVVVGIVVLNQSAVESSLLRKIQQFSDIESSSSTSMRLTRGWDFYMNMDPISQIFGCGFGHLSDYYSSGKMIGSLNYTINQTGYMNSFFSMLCSLGALGFIVYLFAMVKCYSHGCKISKALSVLLMAFMVAGAFMDTAFYYLTIGIIIKTRMITE